MKKVFINIAIIISFIFIYVLQSNFFTWFKIAGVMPNLFVILMLYIGLFMGKASAITYGVIFGILIDIFIGRRLGITPILLVAIGLIGDLLDRNFSKDNRITVMSMVAICTIIYEIGVYILNYFVLNINIEIIAFIKILSIETIYNVILTIIIYPIMQLTGDEVEKQYKGRKILTRYF